MYVGTFLSNNLIRVEVRIGGVAQPLYRSPSLGRVFVAGKPGEVYTLFVQPLGHGRIEVVNSVDGRNTLKDEPAYLDRVRGKIFGGPGEFTGWRISSTEELEFKFGEPEVSISYQASGHASSVGVIGFAAYREASPMPYMPQPYGGGFGGYKSSSSPAAFTEVVRGPAPSFEYGHVTRSAAPAEPTIGTGAGERRYNPLSSTHFNRASGEPDILEIGYQTPEWLYAQGLIAPPLPQAFPKRDTGYGGYQTI